MIHGGRQRQQQGIFFGKYADREDEGRVNYTFDPKAVEELVKKYHLEECFSFLEDYRRQLRVFRAGKREQVFGQAEERQEIYILLSGRVKVYATMSNGRQLLLHYHDKMGLFGESILAEEELDDNNYYYTETLTEIVGIALYVTPIRELLMRDVKFLRFYIRSLQRRFRQLGSAQPMNVLNSSQRNVAGYIWSKLASRGKEQEEPFYFHENLREVSELMGISYRHLHRVLRGLMDQGILARTDRGYLVTDAAGLRRLVEQL